MMPLIVADAGDATPSWSIRAMPAPPRYAAMPRCFRADMRHAAIYIRLYTRRCQRYAIRLFSIFAAIHDAAMPPAITRYAATRCWHTALLHLIQRCFARYDVAATLLMLFLRHFAAASFSRFFFFFFASPLSSFSAIADDCCRHIYAAITPMAAIRRCFDYAMTLLPCCHAIVAAMPPWPLRCCHAIED